MDQLSRLIYFSAGLLLGAVVVTGTVDFYKIEYNSCTLGYSEALAKTRPHDNIQELRSHMDTFCHEFFKGSLKNG